MSLRDVFARNLRRLRHAKGVSQEELAADAEISREYLGILFKHLDCEHDEVIKINGIRPFQFILIAHIDLRQLFVKTESFTGREEFLRTYKRCFQEIHPR